MRKKREQLVVGGGKRERGVGNSRWVSLSHTDGWIGAVAVSPSLLIARRCILVGLLLLTDEPHVFPCSAAGLQHTWYSCNTLVKCF